MNRRVAVSLRLTFATLAATLAVTAPACTCQRAENVAAKERLTRPAVDERVQALVVEKIDVDRLSDEAVMSRVCRMDAGEIEGRLGSFEYTSDAQLTFGREGEAGVRSAEKSRVLQAANGDFSVDVVTGDQSEMKLAYVNEIFFLKNGNGQWRMSRDPTGERDQHRTDALSAWRSFFDLFAHALTATKSGVESDGGREVVKYTLSVADQSAEAKAAGSLLPAPPATPPTPTSAGEGVPPAPEAPSETDDAKRVRISERVRKWRERAKPAGGRGELWVDASTGVLVFVKFDGALVVGDQPNPARLTVKMEQHITGVGRDPVVAMPKDAIAEVVRNKSAAKPRALLETAGIVAPLPKADGSPSDSGSKPPPSAKDPEDQE